LALQHGDHPIHGAFAQAGHSGKRLVGGLAEGDAIQRR
jgi:hypothetical protein